MGRRATNATEGDASGIASGGTHRAEDDLIARNKGRRAILAGWLLTMIGILGYIVAMSRAGANAGMLDALATQGVLGWGSLLFLLGGVVTWVIGNVAMLNEAAQTPRSDARDDG